MVKIANDDSMWIFYLSLKSSQSYEYLFSFDIVSAVFLAFIL